MHLARCPVCKTKSSLLAVAQDEAQKELMSILLKLDVIQGAALMSYLSLFASDKRELANDRALRLAKSALAMSTVELVTTAMHQTVETLRGREDSRLKDHNYLKKVLASVEQQQVVPVAQVMQKPALPKSATAQAIMLLQQDKGGLHE